MRYRSSSNALSYIIIILLCVLIAMGIYAIKEFSSKNSQAPLPKQNTATTTKETPKATTTTSVPSNPLYNGITDVGFVSFASSVIDKKCPFYVPDGVTYHQCLSDWTEDLEKKSLPEQVDEVHAYCEMFSKKFADKVSFESSELFTKCAIYKLQP